MGITAPFVKQCFVVVGSSINVSQLGMVIGFAAVVLPQLSSEDSTIPIDDSSGSWIAALPGFALLVGNFIIPAIMAKLGRKKANIISILIVIVGWACIAAAPNIFCLLCARFLQGISVGMSSCLTPIIIGECTSPRNRGAFTITMSVIMATATLTVHTFGSFFSWRITALAIVIVSLINILMVAFTKESPSWLAEQGKYDECEKVFKWLRGDENEELVKLIQTNKESRQNKATKSSVRSVVRSYLSTVKKKEFYKPIIIMAHLFTMGQVGGINIIAPYIGRMVHETMGSSFNITRFVISVDVQRVISSVLAVFIIRRVKRRTMLFVTCGINVFVYFISALYLYAKMGNMLPFDHPVIGGLLIHMLTMTVAIGSLPLPYTISGEIFALKYRSLSSGISAAICSINIFVTIKTFPYLVSSIDLYGVYCIYSGIMIYCLSVAWFLMPETKDRTLQEIEESFKGMVDDGDLKAAEPLRVMKRNCIEE